MALLIVAGTYVFVNRGGKAKKAPAPPAAAVIADRLFAADPAATASGRTRTLTAIAAAGSTVVAVGSESGGPYARATFFVSTDGGKTWRAGGQRGADGANPPPAEAPGFVAGGSGAWAALGGTNSGVTAWNSADGLTWTRQPDMPAFQEPDTPTGLARTASGFVAVGTTTVSGGSRGILWTSPDGRSWQRLSADQLKPPSGGVITQLTDVAAIGNTVVAHGVLAEPKKKPAEGFWRSPDGGRTWAGVDVPQAQGSGGTATDVTTGGNGFFTAREAQRTTGPKKHKKTVHYVVVFGSPDGTQWSPTGRIELSDYKSVNAMTGSNAGPAALVSVASGKTAVLNSPDGKTWTRAGDIPSADQISAAAPSPAGVLVAGHQGSAAVLTVAGGGDANLGPVPPERSVTDVFGAPTGQVVAVGGTNGSAAAWTSPNGVSWTRGALPNGVGPGELTSVAHGPAGWLAVGSGGSGPLALTSPDGITWQPAHVPGGAFSAAAAGPRGYVIVGSQQQGAAAWFSPDLKTWTPGAPAGKNDLTGAKTQMSAVVAGVSSFVAVGVRGGVPATWTSADGQKWALSQAVTAASGTLDHVAAVGSALVTTGSVSGSALVLRSVDGGGTWQQVNLPGISAGHVMTAATGVSGAGGRFVLAGTAGPPGGADVVLWSSADGTTWRLSRPHGTGLDGPGAQELTGLAIAGGRLLAVGFTADWRADQSTFWRAPLP